MQCVFCDNPIKKTKKDLSSQVNRLLTMLNQLLKENKYLKELLGKNHHYTATLSNGNHVSLHLASRNMTPEDIDTLEKWLDLCLQPMRSDAKRKVIDT